MRDIDLARNIVNQILDEAGTDVETRQRINDDCDAFVVRLLREHCQLTSEVPHEYN